MSFQWVLSHCPHIHIPLKLLLPSCAISAFFSTSLILVYFSVQEKEEHMLLYFLFYNPIELDLSPTPGLRLHWIMSKRNLSQKTKSLSLPSRNLFIQERRCTYTQKYGLQKKYIKFTWNCRVQVKWTLMLLIHSFTHSLNHSTVLEH